MPSFQIKKWSGEGLSGFTKKSKSEKHNSSSGYLDLGSRLLNFLRLALMLWAASDFLKNMGISIILPAWKGMFLCFLWLMKLELCPHDSTNLINIREV